MNIYSLEEFNEMKKNKKLLLVGYSIYDVSEYYKLHPGSANAILKNLHADATVHYNFHSKSAKKIWAKYKIGEIYRNNTCCIL